MSTVERDYTPDDIDDLRQACEEKYLFGTCAPRTGGRVSDSYRESDKVIAVEEMIRTYMIAGLDAGDLREADKRKEEKRKLGKNSSNNSQQR